MPRQRDPAESSGRVDQVLDDDAQLLDDWAEDVTWSALGDPPAPRSWGEQARAGDNPLQALVQADLERRYFEAQVVECVAAARAAGCGWDEIGSALGMSKQGAWDKYR